MAHLEQTTGSPAAELCSRKKGPGSRTGLLPNWRGWIRDLVLSLVIAGAVIVFLYQPVKVEGTSMMPQLTDQERIFINKFIYRFEPIHRGDVVVFRHPLDLDKSYIKRVIGLPGETVSLANGEVLVNGQALEEPYVLPEYRGLQNYGPIVVPPGKFFLLGDRRNSSSDSRSWGTISESFIYGKAVFVYWPVDQLGILR